MSKSTLIILPSRCSQPETCPCSRDPLGQGRRHEGRLHPSRPPVAALQEPRGRRREQDRRVRCSVRPGRWCDDIRSTSANATVSSSLEAFPFVLQIDAPYGDREFSVGCARRFDQLVSSRSMDSIPPNCHLEARNSSWGSNLVFIRNTFFVDIDPVSAAGRSIAESRMSQDLKSIEFFNSSLALSSNQCSLWCLLASSSKTKEGKLRTMLYPE